MLNKRFFIFGIIIYAILIGGCRSDYLVVKHIKPKNYDRPYDPKKDKRKQRTKKVKRLIIRQKDYDAKR